MLRRESPWKAGSRYHLQLTIPLSLFEYKFTSYLMLNNRKGL
jgi:hypothetical protein